MKDVTVFGNIITDTDNSAVRLIGAVNVLIDANVIDGAGKYVVIDDSSKFHPTWFSDRVTIGSNVFEDSAGTAVEDWLRDRSEETKLIFLDTEDGVVPDFEVPGTTEGTDVAGTDVAGTDVAGTDVAGTGVDSGGSSDMITIKTVCTMPDVGKTWSAPPEVVHLLG